MRMPVSHFRRRLSSRSQTRRLLDGAWPPKSGLCHVSRLPPELLELVFLQWRQIDPPDAELGYYGWLSVLLVCRSWMTIARRCSVLWATISGPHLTPRWVLKMLKLSKATPLVLSLDYSKNSSTDLSPRRLLSSPIVSRLHHLDLTLSDHDPEGAIALHEAPSAPELRSLTISVNHVVLTLPTVLFTSSLPRLESLTLKGCTIPWIATSIFDHLVHLSIVVPHGSESVYNSTEERNVAFHDAMEAFRRVGPTLRSLTLRNFIPPSPAHDNHDSSGLPIPLQVLQDLILEGEPSHVTTFISLLSLPPPVNTSVFLNCDSPAVLLDAMRKLGLPFLRPIMLEIDFDSAECVELALRLHLPPAPGASHGHTQALYVNRMVDGYRWDTFNAYTDVVRTIHLGQVQTLVHYASFVRFWSSSTWRALFPQTRAFSLRTIIAAGEPATISLLDALAPDDDGAGKCVLAPHLQRLQLAPLHAGHIRSARRPECLVLPNFKHMRGISGYPIPSIVTVGVDGPGWVDVRRTGCA
ncbi:hypothetical protein K488DRAFT_83922 [Vararia minispora EC-137]|uniref:Uncharacterized protein n=1 Tax=Vararia minispora EC-137 TaxID=1314806 RepID=A0ACB8QSJ7_9AGAM|nr:hypothetical protein K488DRAFT_83922 [Vararia minispora EC-137]